MADDMKFDFTEINALAADLGKVADNAGPNIRKAVEITSLLIKRDWQAPLKGSKTLPALPYALTYDVGAKLGLGGSTVESEIGFDRGRKQGQLGHISETGSPTIAGRGYGLAALAANRADFEKGLAIALEQAQKKAGL